MAAVLRPQAIKPIFAKYPVAHLLKAHLKQKLANSWVGEVLFDPKKITAYFPYGINPGSTVTEIMDTGFQTHVLGQPTPSSLKMKSVYMIMMPTVAIPIERVVTIVKAIENESFGETTTQSRPEASRRIVLTMGVNQAYSADSARNAEFRHYAATFPQKLNQKYPNRSLALRVVPFFWNPWKLKAKDPSQLIFSLEKCYMLVKSHLQCDLNTFNGWMKLTSKTMPKLIPYQAIRNTIMRSEGLLNVSKAFFRSHPRALQYVHSMDSDFASLKTTSLGLFSHYDRMIDERISKGKKPPSAMCTGYAAPKSEKMVLIAFGIELDRQIRQAVASVLPPAAYMTEPNFGFHLQKSTDLKKHSWKGGSDMTTESRRFMANAFASKLLDPDGVVFSATGAIATEIDEAWATAVTKKVTVLTPEVLAKAETLKTLKGLHQSYCNQQILANNIYNAFGKTVANHMEKVIVPFKHILGAFDPFALIEYLKLNGGKYSKAMFDEAQALYRDYVKVLVDALSHKTENPLAKVEDATLRDKLKRPVETQKKVFLDAIKALQSAGYTKQELKKLILISFRTGNVKYKFLTQ